MSSFISSLAQNLFTFAVLIHINNQALLNIHIYYFSHLFHVLAMFQLYYIFNYFMHFSMFFSIILLRKISPGKSYQNHFKFTTWIHCIIPIYMFLITSWYIWSFFYILGCFLVFLFRKMLTGNIVIFIITFISLYL